MDSSVAGTSGKYGEMCLGGILLVVRERAEPSRRHGGSGGPEGAAAPLDEDAEAKAVCLAAANASADGTRRGPAPLWRASSANRSSSVASSSAHV
jgi:hypothetical protein